MRSRQRIVLPSGHALHVEFITKLITHTSPTTVLLHDDYWFLWLGANTAFTDGYGVRLYTDGRIEHWRVSADGWEERLDKET